MRQQIEARLNALRTEYEKGQAQLRQLESQSASVRETLLRISGAIMVLEEMLASPPPTSIAAIQQPPEAQPGLTGVASAA